MSKPRKGTKTSVFGSSKRENHDSSPFYKSNLYVAMPPENNMPYEETPLPLNITNTIINSSSEDMKELPDNSVHLMVTSPPYNVGKEYDQDLTLRDYLSFLKTVWKETRRVLVPGGRVCINIANLGRKPYIPLHSFIIKDLLDLGFLMRGEIIWDKSSSAGTSTAWGSWQSPSNPTLRDTHEYILVFSKQYFKRPNPHKRKPTITKEEFLKYTKSVWNMPTASAKKIGHPAPFPVELPYALIQLYTFENEVILDPFMGSGQTAIAALKANRKFVGYETNKEYINLAQKRITNFIENNKKNTLNMKR